MRQKLQSRGPTRAHPAFEVAQWDVEEARWVTWEEQQTESWIRKAAEKKFNQWNHPGIWFAKELELNNAAKFLWSTYLENRAHAPVGGRPHVINFPNTVLMLAAMSVECLFKGTLFCLLPYPPQRDQVAAIAKGAHNLSDLLLKLGWRSNAKDRLILESLSHYVRWAGRYPLPRSSTELAEARINGVSNEEAWEGYCALRNKYGRRVASSLRQWARNMKHPLPSR